MIFTQLLEKYRENANSNRNQGDRFELLIKRYLKIKPEFRSQLKDVWLWSEFPYKSQFGTGGKDTGIDIVCRTNIDEYWAVQCKFFDAKKTITLDDISTFVTTSSLDFDANGVKKKFSHRIWIDTTQNGFNSEAQNYANKLHICRLGRFDLEKDDIDWESLDKGQISNSAHKKKYDLRAHQKSAFDDTIAYFKDENNTRGRLIMACGTGKTFTSLRIAEEMAGKGRGLVLFLVPSIALLSQSLKEWCAQSKDNIYPICICSDSKASNVKYDESISDLALPASTDRDVIYNNFIKYQQLKDKNGGLVVVFSTYQSIDVISSVQAEINKKANDSFIFDLIICDEAHRTTGVEQVGKEKSSFTKVHDANFIKADKRLYMTATPRLYSPDHLILVCNRILP